MPLNKETKPKRVWPWISSKRDGLLDYSEFESSSHYYVHFQTYSWERYRVCARGEMVKAMDCGIIVSEFVLQSCYYVYFRVNTLGKGMNLLILPAMS